MPLKISIPLIFLLILSAAAASAQKKSAVIRVGIVNGAATVLPKPDYPPQAKDFCARGKVEVEVLIGEDGAVLEAEAISGDELLRDVSVEAAKKAKFRQMADAPPVKWKGIVVYNFDFLAPKCLTVGIVNRKALKIPKPLLSMRQRLLPEKELVMAVLIVVDMNGKVTAARAVSGHPLIRSALEKAARQAQFSPIIATIPPIKVRGLLVYKFEPDGKFDTDIERDDKTVIGAPVNLIEPLPPFCNCKFGGKISSVLVEAKTDEQGNVTEAKARSGHPVLRNICEKAARESTFLPTNTKAKIFLVYNFEAPDESARDVRFRNVEIKEVRIEK